MNSKLESASFIWCSSNELRQVAFGSGPFACWLHFCKREWPDFGVVIHYLVEQGCSLIYSSGMGSKHWHDKADDYLINLKREDVLTAWCDDSIQECAEEFWDITWRYLPKRLIAIIGDSQSDECQFAAEIISVLGTQQADRAERNPPRRNLDFL